MMAMGQLPARRLFIQTLVRRDTKTIRNPKMNAGQCSIERDIKKIWKQIILPGRDICLTRSFGQDPILMRMSGNIKRCSTYRMASAYYANQPLPDTNARGPAITVRPASTALLTIDSEDRYSSYTDNRNNPTSPYQFTIRKNENMMAGFFTRLAVTEINFPFTVPNINKKTQTIGVSYSANGTSPVALATITIGTGFYTPSQLASKIQASVRALDASLAGFILLYGSIDYLHTPGVGGAEPVFSYGTGNATTIAFNPLPYNTSAYPYSPQTKQLFDLLGFIDVNQTLDTSTYGGFTLCQAIRYIDVVCNQLTAVSALKDNTSQPVVRDMLCRLYLGDGGGTGQSTTPPDNSAFCPPGCAPLTIYRAFPHPKQIQWLPAQNISGFLQFSVYDDAGDILSATANQESPSVAYIGEGNDWSMSLLVTEN